MRVSARRAVLMLTALSALAFGVMSPPGTAHAGGIGSTTILRSWQTGLCLDSNYDGDVYTLACNGGNYQNWQIAAAPGGGIVREITLYDAQTGRCLYVNASSSWGSLRTEDPRYCYWDYGYGPSTNATFVWAGDDYKGQYINLYNNQCLDANQPGLPPYTNSYCYTGGYQDWRQGF